MKTLVFAFAVVIGCAPASAATPSPSVTASPAATFNAKWFSVAVIAMPVGDDPKPAAITAYLRSSLEASWRIAAHDRGVLFVNGAERSDVLVVVDSSKNPRQLAWGLTTAWTRVIVLHEIEDAPMEAYTKSALHELGHALGCCKGPKTDGIHMVCPVPAVGPLMCPDGGDAKTFSEDELAPMGL